MSSRRPRQPDCPALLSLSRVGVCSLAALLAWTHETAAQELPSAAVVLERMTESLGGAAAIDALPSLRVRADCTGPDGPFVTRVESLRPGRSYFHQQAGDDTLEVIVVGDDVWQIGADGLAAMDPGFASFVRGHEFHLEVFEAAQRFSGHRSVERANVEGRDCIQVAMRDAQGLPAQLCVDSSTWLPVVLEVNPEGAAGPVRTYFDDWREVNGLLYFWSFRLTEGSERVFTYDYREIVPGGADPDRYQAPGRD